MQTLSYGYLKPQSGDSGSIWFPAMEDNIVQLNGHNHNGVNSALLTSASMVPLTQSILAGAWVATTGGTYRQIITMPVGLTYGLCYISFLLTASGNQTYPTVEKISSTTYYVYTNDNSLGYTAVYVS